eukprot:Opistho-2@56591
MASPPLPARRSKEPNNAVVLRVPIDVKIARARGQTRHGGHLANKRVEESGANACPHLPDGNHEPLGSALLLGIRRQRQVCLGHADWQVRKALLHIARNLLGCMGEDFNAIGAVNLAGDGLDLLFDGEIEVVQKLKVGRLAARALNSLGEVLGALAAQSPVLARDGIICTRRKRRLPHNLAFVVRVGAEVVDGDYNGNAKVARVLNLFGKVARAGLDEGQVLLGVFDRQRLAGDDLRAAAVHLERPDGRDKHDAVGTKTTVPALDVEELLHSNVRTESSLCNNISVGTGEFECDAIGNDRRVSVGNVGKGTRVDKHGRSLEGLHEVGANGVLHKHSESTGNTEVVGGHRASRAARGDDHITQALAHVLWRGRERKHSHDFGRNRNVETGDALVADLRWRLADGDLAQKAVVGVHHAAPRDCFGIDVQTPCTLR